ncbi:fumarylacetoacetate hydrolase family protein [Streptomyces sp. MZ04]|uniref:fumarylacetoacetate hydrolase family protein n=1 Tax=Streptomyces sp. MZ04 TaxID=2559236 RepID=UPI001ADF29CB|nr:fumarylacetoacetate hydrolase family protein [Streptomyces sp. MZ04]
MHGQEIYTLPPGDSLADLLAAGTGVLERAGQQALAKPDQVVELDRVRLCAPIPRPPALFDALCYLDHLRACRVAQGQPEDLPEVWQQIPAVYQGNHRTVVGPYDDMPIFPGSRMFDFELEVGIVIGRPGRDIDPERALSHIAGYTLLCDWSARDVQLREMQLGIGVLKGKDGGTSLGPWLVTADEFDATVPISAYVGDELIGAGSVGDRKSGDWRFEDVISHISRGSTLEAGDVIGSGTLPGGCLLEHMAAAGFRGWLKPGDVVRLSSPQLGEIRQTIRASSDGAFPGSSAELPGNVRPGILTSAPSSPSGSGQSIAKEIGTVSC